MAPDRYDKPTEHAEQALREWAFADQAKDEAVQRFEEARGLQPPERPDEEAPEWFREVEERWERERTRMEQDRDPYEESMERYPKRSDWRPGET